VTVFLVGAGPGDPGLLTLRGAEALAMADVVVYDRLSVSALLDLAPPGAERISVAKSAGRAVMPQDDINALLVEKAKQGLTVVRLKGGDPFVFARGGDEAAALAAACLHYEVVPGVTSAIAVPAYAGIPVTLRHSSTSFTVITGHEDPDKSDEVNWEAAAQLGGTIVILMGIGRLPKIVDRLLAGGLAPDTPAAAIRWGTRPEQHTVRSTLSAIAREQLASPSVIVVGQVAAMDLSWFESRPLFGKKVIVTRPRHQSSVLADRLRDEGANALIVPTIEIVDPLDGGAALNAAVAQASSYDWIVLTSANGAARFCERLRDGRDLAGVKIAVSKRSLFLMTLINGESCLRVLRSPATFCPTACATWVGASMSSMPTERFQWNPLTPSANESLVPTWSHSLPHQRSTTGLRHSGSTRSPSLLRALVQSRPTRRVEPGFVST